MGRPATHTDQSFIDAAVGFFAEGGARAVTMMAVARKVGAPSGSIYHRFPDRPALLAAVWLRTVHRFQEEYRKVLGQNPTPQEGVNSAAWVVDWCRAHLPEAIVLQAGKRTFDPESWSDAARTELTQLDAAMSRTLTRVVNALAAQTGRPSEETRFALVDLPLAAVQRHLLAGQAPPPGVTRLVRNVAQRLIPNEPAGVGPGEGGGTQPRSQS